MLDYYLISRKVNSFEALRDLLICDRIKSILSDGALGHVLRFESNLADKWASKDQLADILDVYFHNFDKTGRPRASALGAAVTNHDSAQRAGHYRGGNVGPNQSDNWGKDKKTVSSFPSVNPSGEGRKAAVKDIADMVCFKCGQKGHMRRHCPGKTEATGARGGPNSGYKPFFECQK